MSIHTAIVVGHNAVGQGAERVTDGVSEWVWNTKLAKMIQAHDPDNIGISTAMRARAGTLARSTRCMQRSQQQQQQQ